MGEHTLRAIDWQNQELDKQTKALEETASQIQKSRSQIGECASKINEKLKETTKETQDIAPIFVDTNTADILHSIGAQTNNPLKLNLVNFPTRKNKMNGVNITLEQGAFLFMNKIYKLSDGFINFLTNPDVLYGGIQEDKYKIKRFLLDTRYDLRKDDKRSSRYRQ